MGILYFTFLTVSLPCGEVFKGAFKIERRQGKKLLLGLPRHWWSSNKWTESWSALDVKGTETAQHGMLKDQRKNPGWLTGSEPEQIREWWRHLAKRADSGRGGLAGLQGGRETGIIFKFEIPINISTTALSSRVPLPWPYTARFRDSTAPGLRR